MMFPVVKEILLEVQRLLVTASYYQNSAENLGLQAEDAEPGS